MSQVCVACGEETDNYFFFDYSPYCVNPNLGGLLGSYAALTDKGTLRFHTEQTLISKSFLPWQESREVTPENRQNNQKHFTLINETFPKGYTSRWMNVGQAAAQDLFTARQYYLQTIPLYPSYWELWAALNNREIDEHIFYLYYRASFRGLEDSFYHEEIIQNALPAALLRPIAWDLSQGQNITNKSITWNHSDSLFKDWKHIAHAMKIRHILINQIYRAFIGATNPVIFPSLYGFSYLRRHEGWSPYFGCQELDNLMGWLGIVAFHSLGDTNHQKESNYVAIQRWFNTNYGKYAGELFDTGYIKGNGGESSMFFVNPHHKRFSKAFERLGQKYTLTDEYAVLDEEIHSNIIHEHAEDMGVCHLCYQEYHKECRGFYIATGTDNKTVCNCIADKDHALENGVLLDTLVAETNLGELWEMSDDCCKNDHITCSGFYSLKPETEYAETITADCTCPCHEPEEKEGD